MKQHRIHDGQMVPFLNLSWPWNAKHPICFHLMDATATFRRFLTVGFSNKDASIYLMPAYEDEYSVQSMDGSVSLRHQRGKKFRISLHPSGVVNLHTSERQPRLRGPLSIKRDPLHVVTLQINQQENLPEASIAEFNSPNGGHLNLPMFGFPTCPMMLSVFVVCDNERWNTPHLGNKLLADYETRLTNGRHVFHFVQWQQSDMPRGVGDIGLQLFDGASAHQSQR